MSHDNRTAFLTTRLTEAQRAKIQRAAKACDESLSTFTRRALTARAAGDLGAANDATASRVRLSSNPARLAIKHLVALAAVDPVDPVDALAQLCATLGLPPDADAKTIQAAVDALLATIGGGDAGADPLASTTDPKPPALSAFSRLTPAERVRAAKLGITNAAQFEAAKTKLTRRA